MHDVRVAWWRAEAAQRLLPAADALLAEIDRANEKTRVIEARKLLPPLQTATLRRALLDLSQQISFRRYELAQARIELAALVNVPPGTDIRIAAPADEKREVLDLTADLDKLEALALRSRPEIAEEGYRARISEDEARKALVALLPGTRPGRRAQLGRQQVPRQQHLEHSAGVSVLFNLVKVVFAAGAQPLGGGAEAGRHAPAGWRWRWRSSTQTRIAAVRYTLVADEFLVWDDASRDDDTIVKYLASSAQVGIDTELELIRAKARALASRMNRDLAYANRAGERGAPVQLGRLRRGARRPTRPRPLPSCRGWWMRGSPSSSTRAFHQRAEPERAAVAVGEISGMRERAAGLRAHRRGHHPRPVEGAPSWIPRLPISGCGSRPSVDDPADGRRCGARGDRVRRRRAGAASRVEFKTTLSEPVDDEQWRALGEGAAYRALDSLVALPVRRPSLRPSLTLQVPPENAARAAAPGQTSGLDGEPLVLRAEHAMQSVRRIRGDAPRIPG